jgi:hypothetical protein
MPIPKPKPGESRSDFVSRCISTVTKLDPSRKPEQVQAICFDTWRRSKENMEEKEKDKKDEEEEEEETKYDEDGKIIVAENVPILLQAELNVVETEKEE